MIRSPSGDRGGESAHPWGVDPLTGCASRPFLYAVLDGLCRQAGAGVGTAEDWVMVICDLPPSPTPEAALIRQVAFGARLRTSLSWARVIAYLDAGRYVVVARAGHAHATAQAVLSAAHATGSRTCVSVCTVPRSVDAAWRTARSGRFRHR